MQFIVCFALWLVYSAAQTLGLYNQLPGYSAPVVTPDVRMRGYCQNLDVNVERDECAAMINGTIITMCGLCGI